MNENATINGRLQQQLNEVELLRQKLNGFFADLRALLLDQYGIDRMAQMQREEAARLREQLKAQAKGDAPLPATPATNEEPPRYARLSLNETVYVRLTGAGEYAWEAYFRKGHVYGVASRLARTMEDGRLRFLLWELLVIFGPNVHIGSEAVFFENTIYFRETRDNDRARPHA